MNKIIEEIKSYITKNGQYDIKIDENLFENGLLDSMGVLEVISLIEDASGKDFNPELFIMENFQTLNSINKFILKEIDD